MVFALIVMALVKRGIQWDIFAAITNAVCVIILTKI